MVLTYHKLSEKLPESAELMKCTVGIYTAFGICNYLITIELGACGLNISKYMIEITYVYTITVIFHLTTFLLQRYKSLHLA